MPRNLLDDKISGEENNPWSQYRRLVLSTLENINDDIKELERKLNDKDKAVWTEFNEFKLKCTEDLTALKVKAGLIGAVSGIIGSTIVVGIFKLIIK